MTKAAPTFETWMQQVDTHLLNTIYLTHEDLADMPYYEMYEDGMNPKDAATETLIENGAGSLL